MKIQIIHYKYPFSIRINKGFREWLKPIVAGYRDYTGDNKINYFSRELDLWSSFISQNNKEYGNKTKRIARKIYNRMKKLKIVGCYFEVLK